MTVISSKEFATNQNKYFELAINEQVYIENGEDVFHLTHTDTNNTVVKERVYHEPDEDFYSAITMEEFKKRALEMTERIDKMYSKK